MPFFPPLLGPWRPRPNSQYAPREVIIEELLLLYGETEKTKGLQRDGDVVSVGRGALLFSPHEEEEAAHTEGSEGGGAPPGNGPGIECWRRGQPPRLFTCMAGGGQYRRRRALSGEKCVYRRRRQQSFFNAIRSPAELAPAALSPARRKTAEGKRRAKKVLSMKTGRALKADFFSAF